VFVVMPQSRRSFVERLDFVTSLGHGEGGDHRKRLGVLTRGPTRVITDLCVMEPDVETKELTVTSLHPGATIDGVRDATGWPLRIAASVAETSPPTRVELEILRDLHRRTAEAHRPAAATTR
jgi:glutaconate CoA-transferase subunit B